MATHNKTKTQAGSAQSALETLPPQETALFCHQLTLILNSDIPLEDGAAALAEDAGDGAEKALLQRVADALNDHQPLEKALQDTGAFPDYMVGMVGIGEKSGKLESILKELAAFYEREDRLQKGIRNAVGYPLFLIIMMAVVMVVLVWKVLPIFRQVVSGFGASVAASAQKAMNAGQVLGVASLVLVAFLLGVTLMIYFNVRRNRNQDTIRAAFGNTGITRKISHKMALSRFASVMYTMFVSGYQAEEALSLSATVLEDAEVSAKVKDCQAGIDRGNSFAEALTDTGMFSGVYARMIGIGFKTGGIDTVMKKLSQVYGEDAEESVDRLVAVIEPVLVGVLSILIGAVLLSVMLPLVGVMSSIG